MVCPRFCVFTAIFHEIVPGLVVAYSELGRNHRIARYGICRGFLHFLRRMAERICLMFSVTRKLLWDHRPKKMHEVSAFNTCGIIG